MPRPRNRATRLADQGKASGTRIMQQHRDVNSGHVVEQADARRKAVYRTDVEFAPAERKPNPLPPRGSLARRTLVKLIVDMRNMGMSTHAIANEIPWSQSTVCQLLREAREEEQRERKKETE